MPYTVLFFPTTNGRGAGELLPELEGQSGIAFELTTTKSMRSQHTRRTGVCGWRSKPSSAWRWCGGEIGGGRFSECRVVAAPAGRAGDAADARKRGEFAEPPANSW